MSPNLRQMIFFRPPEDADIRLPVIPRARRRTLWRNYFFTTRDASCGECKKEVEGTNAPVLNRDVSVLTIGLVQAVGHPVPVRGHHDHEIERAP